MLNSVTAERERLEAILLLAKEADFEIVALVMEEEIPNMVKGRLRSCEKIVASTGKHGITLGNLYFDSPALSTPSATFQGLITLETLRAIKFQFPEARIMLSLSTTTYLLAFLEGHL